MKFRTGCKFEITINSLSPANISPVNTVVFYGAILPIGKGDIIRAYIVNKECPEMSLGERQLENIEQAIKIEKVKQGKVIATYIG